MLLVLVLALAVLAGAAGPAGAWMWPADGPVLQPYLFDHEQPKAPGQHRGIDVAGPLGSVVQAPASGVVSFAGTVPSNGKCVTIDTAGGLAVTLTHLGSITVTKGATVAEGDGVGTIGPIDKTPRAAGSGSIRAMLAPVISRAGKKRVQNLLDSRSPDDQQEGFR
jgi:murein DD-endopeptidase MepM/ murein hydrolase activator NlpD